MHEIHEPNSADVAIVVTDFFRRGLAFCQSEIVPTSLRFPNLVPEQLLD
jgi:hypothetical protein